MMEIHGRAEIYPTINVRNINIPAQYNTSDIELALIILTLVSFGSVV
jgi:hypothetical protein